MSVRIQVTDRNSRPVVGARVFVSWSGGGHSERRTDQNGIANLECSAGTAEYVQVNGRQVLSRMYLKDGINPVSDR